MRLSSADQLPQGLRPLGTSGDIIADPYQCWIPAARPSPATKKISEYVVEVADKDSIHYPLCHQVTKRRAQPTLPLIVEVICTRGPRERADGEDLLTWNRWAEPTLPVAPRAGQGDARLFLLEEGGTISRLRGGRAEGGQSGDWRSRGHPATLGVDTPGGKRENAIR